MELLQLQYFQTVARMEHMTKAAEALRIAQPALSKTIARLEADLGVPLFDRQGRRIQLNAYGKAFLKKVNSALGILEEGKQELADLAGLAGGTIHLATNNLGRLTNALGAFRKQEPDIHFRIRQIVPSQMDDMAELLLEGEIDLCFSAASFDRAEIGELPVWDAEVFLAVPAGHRFEQRTSIRLSEAAHEPFVEYRKGHPFRKTNDSFCRQAGFQQHVVCEVEEPDALGSLVQAGLGVAFVPACRPNDVQALTLVPIEEPVCRRSFTLAWDERRYQPKAVRTFQLFLARYFAELHAGL